MKSFFFAVFMVLVLSSILAWQIQPKPVKPGEVELTWVSDDNPARREQIALFNRLHPGCQLKFDPGSGTMGKVVVQSLAGVGPDLFECASGSQLALLVKSGIVADITDDLSNAGIDIKRVAWNSAYPLTTLDGRVYGFPTNVSVNAVWYNKEIFDRYGIQYPTGRQTWKAFVPLAQRLTRRDKNGHIKQYGFMYDWYNWPTFVMQWGGRLYTEDGTKCVIDSPQAIDAIQFMHDLVYKYRVSQSPAEESALASQGGWGSSTISLFGAGKSAMALGGRWWLCTLRNYKGLNLGVMECPHGSNRVFVSFGRAVLVNSNSLHRKEALQFLKYMAGKEYNELINHQADGIAPVVKYSYTDKFLHDPAYTKEDYNAVWREAMKHSLPMESSPFVSGGVDERIINTQLDLVKNNQKTAAEAMKTAAAQINAEIAKNIDIDPTLAKRYKELARGKK